MSRVTFKSTIRLTLGTASGILASVIAFRLLVSLKSAEWKDLGLGEICVLAIIAWLAKVSAECFRSRPNALARSFAGMLAFATFLLLMDLPGLSGIIKRITHNDGELIANHEVSINLEILGFLVSVYIIFVPYLSARFAYRMSLRIATRLFAGVKNDQTHESQ